jgi:hypothetical protein
MGQLSAELAEALAGDRLTREVLVRRILKAIAESGDLNADIIQITLELLDPVISYWHTHQRWPTSLKAIGGEEHDPLQNELKQLEEELAQVGARAPTYRASRQGLLDQVVSTNKATVDRADTLDQWCQLSLRGLALLELPEVVADGLHVLFQTGSYQLGLAARIFRGPILAAQAELPPEDDDVQEFMERKLRERIASLTLRIQRRQTMRPDSFDLAIEIAKRLIE